MKTTIELFAGAGGLALGLERAGFEPLALIEIDKDAAETLKLNSSASAKTFMNMQGQLLRDGDCACFLVEVIAKKSQNIPWTISLDGQKQSHKRIRRVSIDKFYKIVTGEENAFYKMCTALPAAIKEILEEVDTLKVPKDTVFVELKENAGRNSFELALLMLGFETYSGFKENFFGRRNDVS